ncbi:transcriptional regulator, PadR-like family [Beutenbergia cavernae DSM 12333]|uniref:Transcriptional regulator, PadR-like family n=1 Tax=Beutenbergia cavernae (strain ATCC BAA-8 / DSM 12333 / CCUG 43141 / JCM 11478 / NBRC 16432 / NCIMB 13614 / HKI 0122) TaxID=471853 RepID=C5BWG6_BEUC1|nr:helix-turn-helix transcriptional regulator [Beutenbergia cavernae]ACQ78624.1 transcriptional regulator, PadR-like family [Beutenbergia cavernae DSM 12333]
MNAEMLKGHLDLLLLAVLEPGPRHGYGVVEALRARSDRALDLPSGTVYPALHRLERTGLISGEWTIHNGRRRRVYALTAAGEARLVARRSDWRGFADVVERVISVPS